jgi:hypothetical protein
MTRGIYDNWYTAWNGCAANAGNIGCVLRKWVADADGARLASTAADVITDIDIVVTCGEIAAGYPIFSDCTRASQKCAARSRQLCRDNGCYAGDANVRGTSLIAQPNRSRREIEFAR